LVAANALGLGSCWLGSVEWKKVKKILDIPDRLEGFAVIALGYPAQEVVVEEGGDERLPRRDERGVLRVPKRTRDAVVHLNQYRDH
jgi:nitroreductase